MDSVFIAGHIQCTAEEKKCCMETANKIITLAQTARRSGLLELEKLARGEDCQTPPLLRPGVLLIVDGTDPAVVKEILENYILSSSLSNKDFLDSMLVCQGILAIQKGDNLRCIKEKLCSLFGLEYRDAFWSYFGQAEIEEELSASLKKYGELLDNLPKTDILDPVTELLDNKGMQRLLQELPFKVAEYAAIGSSREVAAFFLRNMSAGAQQQLFADLPFIHNPDMKITGQVQVEILKIIDELEEKGELIKKQ